MSALMADHRDYADDVRQPSLFDVLAPPSARPQDEAAEAQAGGQVVEFRRREEAAEALVEGEAVADTPTSFVEPAPLVSDSPENAWLTEIAPEVDEAELTALAPGGAEVADELRTPRVAGSPMAGPTLDDMMSRVWEGLAIGLPAACPVCHGEVLPGVEDARIGHCSSCGTTID